MCNICTFSLMASAISRSLELRGCRSGSCLNKGASSGSTLTGWGGGSTNFVGTLTVSKYTFQPRAQSPTFPWPQTPAAPTPPRNISSCSEPWLPCPQSPNTSPCYQKLVVMVFSRLWSPIKLVRICKNLDLSRMNGYGDKHLLYSIGYISARDN